MFRLEATRYEHRPYVGWSASGRSVLRLLQRHNRRAQFADVRRADHRFACRDLNDEAFTEGVTLPVPSCRMSGSPAGNV